MAKIDLIVFDSSRMLLCQKVSRTIEERLLLHVLFLTYGCEASPTENIDLFFSLVVLIAVRLRSISTYRKRLRRLRTPKKEE